MIAIPMLLLLAGPGSPSEIIEISYRCYVSTGAPKHIRLEMAIFGNRRWQGGYVRYMGAKKPISIVERSVKSTELAPDRPLEHESTWMEIVDGRPAGRYIVTTQGARTYGFTYVSAPGLKRVEFVEDLEAQPDGNSGCSWR